MRGQQELAAYGQNPIGLPPLVPALPRPLTLGRQCREYQTLLVAGGLLDQPYLLWTYVQAALDAEDRWHLLQASRKAH